MNIDTPRFGTLEYSEDDIITFAEGLLGFPDSHAYLLFDHGKGPFRWLQSLDEPELAFVVIDPLVFMPRYDVTLDIPDTVMLGMAAEDGQKLSADVGVLVIANVTDPADPTANLLAPICVSVETRRGVQVIQHKSGFSMRHPLKPTRTSNSRRQAA